MRGKLVPLLIGVAIGAWVLPKVLPSVRSMIGR